jgi:uncharacterized protein
MPKKKRAAKPEQERRVYSSPIQIRRAAGDKRTIFGYATKFAPVQSADLGGWIEEIHENAFDDCLRSKPDVAALWNHDPSHVLGRSTSGTLRLSTDKTGLKYEIDPPNTQLASDLIELMDRGDVHQSSFGFYCIEDSWREGPNGTYIRTVLKANLFDVSPVTFPAYPDATSGVRASLRNAPDDLRNKLTKRDDIDDGDTDFDDPTNDLDCEGEDEDDPACTDENRAACECTCKACAENRCERCSDIRCADLRCMRNGCFIQSDEDRRKHNHDVSVLQLRLKLQRHRRPPIGN